MFDKRKKKCDSTVPPKADFCNDSLKEIRLSSVLDENIALIKTLFTDNDTLVSHCLENIHDGSRFFLFYSDGMVNTQNINEHIVEPLITTKLKGVTIPDGLLQKVIQISEAKLCCEVDEIIRCINYGDVILFMEGHAQAIILNSRFFFIRGVSEPPNEKVLSGPREGFSEAIMCNLSMVRRRIRSHELKMKMRELGRRTRTQICICYMEGIVDKKVLEELYRRLDKIDIDAILDSHYITELIRDSNHSPLRTIGTTERPDIVAAKILEGRVAVFVDGSPVVLTLPYLFIENFQSNEDYYMNYYYSSFSRILRILAFVITCVTPATYIAIGAFHHEMFPTNLLISIAAERITVPLPAAMELFIMILIYDILRETGIRMPSNSSQALSIVGALVIGQAAVQASLVAAPVIIVVAITAITGLLVPRMDSSIIFIRFGLLALAASFGLYGLILGLSAIVIHLYNLRSFGVNHLTSFLFPRFQNMKDIFIRAPWQDMIERPYDLTHNRIRLRDESKQK